MTDDLVLDLGIQAQVVTQQIFKTAAHVCADLRFCLPVNAKVHAAVADVEGIHFQKMLGEF